jgi:chromosomal replication initiator protein
LSAEIRIPDYETKVKIIRTKAAILNANVPDDVVCYLAEHISANIREIEGAISSLVANAQFMNKRITIALAKEVLKVYVSLYQKEITIDHIIDVICEQMGVDRERISSSERTREVAIARQLAMFLAKKHTKQPLTNIGAAIGGRNHATVLHSCKTISNLMDTEKMFRQQVEQIEKIILS